jgi:hypothetical protein
LLLLPIQLPPARAHAGFKVKQEGVDAKAVAADAAGPTGRRTTVDILRRIVLLRRTDKSTGVAAAAPPQRLLAWGRPPAPPPRPLVRGASHGTTTDALARERSHRVVLRSSPALAALHGPLRAVETAGGPWWIPSLSLRYDGLPSTPAPYGHLYALEGLPVRHALELAPGERVVGLRVRSGWWVDRLTLLTDAGRVVVLGGEASPVGEAEEWAPAPGAHLAGFEVVVGAELLEDGRDKPGSEHVMGLTTLWALG